MRTKLRHTLSVVFVLVTCLAACAQKPESVDQTGHNNSVDSVAFSPDGRTIASGSEDHTIKLWDAKTGQVVRTLASPQRLGLFCCLQPGRARARLGKS
jgi:WD40 repeat protein